METDEISFKENDLKFNFVKNDNFENVSDDMKVAFTNIQEYFEEEGSIRWISEEECMNSCRRLTKRDVFIFEEFIGPAFEYLKKTKCLIIGPRCMLSCLTENSSVPLGKSPVFTTAMRSLVVCASGLPAKEKARIRKLVSWMGGYYSDDLSLSCTHLVSNTVMSSKYEKAALNNIPIMHPNWVQNVWEKSKKENILATSQQFNEDKLLMFHSLTITASGLSASKRNDIIKLINKYNGNYLGEFKSSKTDILLIEKSDTDSQKYKAAIKFKKEILLPDWIFDSVKKGYALSIQPYKVVNVKISTPTKCNLGLSALDFNMDCTDLSRISCNSTKNNVTVNETLRSMTCLKLGHSPTGLNKKDKNKDYINILSKISIKETKYAGAFLDGCCIFLSGFTIDEKEKLNKVLNAGGAIRFDEINENVTHVLIGEYNPVDIHIINEKKISASLLRLEWLTESINLKQPAPEINFLFQAKVPIVNEPEAPSPSTKKTIQSMNHSFKKPLSRIRIDFDQKPTTSNDPGDNFQAALFEENELLSQYTPANSSQTSPPKPINCNNNESEKYKKLENNSTAGSEMCTETEQLSFLINHTIYIHNHEDDLYEQLKRDCESAGASIVDQNYKGIVDYVIVPVEISTDMEKIPVKYKKVINNLWVEDVMTNNRLEDINYYHLPIPITADSTPLEGMGIVISTYAATERDYIDKLATYMGAYVYESYAKKDHPLLICPSSTGAKYEAAVKWEFPVVISRWLVECAAIGEILPIEPYLVGTTTISLSWSSATVKNTSDIRKKLTLDTKKSVNSNRSTSQSNDSSKEGCPNECNKTTNNNDDVSSLKHKRLTEIRDSSVRYSQRESIGSPNLSPLPTALPSLNTSDFVKELPTPNRACVYEAIKEWVNKDTPQSQRLKQLVQTPGGKTISPQTPKMPEFVTTPEIRKRRLAFWDSYYLPIVKRERKPSTPISELKKRFWKEALGDSYVEEAENASNSQSEDNDVFDNNYNNPKIDDGLDTQNLAAKNIHVKHLSDFIKNRTKKEKYDDLNEEENDGLLQKLDSEMMGCTEEMVGWCDPSEINPIRKSKLNSMKYQGTPKFNISTTNENLKLEIVNKIKQLNGEVCYDLTKFDPTCSHIVCEIPNRGEKILSGIASGKWILGLKYIEDSFEAGSFLDEELYEWGNPKATVLPKVEGSIDSLAKAAFRWRTKLSSHSNKNVGVFTGFRIILHVEKKERYETLITSGDGVVLNVTEPYHESDEALKATHCLVETRSKQLTEDDYKELSKAGVRILSVVYLNAYITGDSIRDYSKYKVKS